MADVTSIDDGSAPSTRERAQLLIVIGIVVAIALVSLALFLNSIIYAENVGARGADTGGGEASEFLSTVEAEGQLLLEDAREETGDGEYVADTEDFNASIQEWNDQTRLHSTSRGVYTIVTVDHVDPDGSSAILDVTYESERITYESKIEIEPGESGD